MHVRRRPVQCTRQSTGEESDIGWDRAKNRVERKARTLVFFIGMPTELVRDLDKEEINYVQATIRAAFRTILANAIESQNFAENTDTEQGNKRFKQN